MIDGNRLGNVPGMRVSVGEEIEISPFRRVNVDDRLVSGVPGETIAAYFIPTDDSLGDAWTLQTFDDSAWERGPTGLGFEGRDNFAELLNTEVDPREVNVEATNILARISFEIDDLSAIEDLEPDRDGLQRGSTFGL